MRVVIGSKSEDKIKILGNALKELRLDIEVVGIDVNSEITNQPLDKVTTRMGAMARARNAKKKEPDAKLWFGLEGGLQDYGEGYHLVTFACLIDVDGNESTGEGEEIHLPPDVSNKIKNGESFGKIIRDYAKKHKIDKNLITRLIPFAQAVQNSYAEYLKVSGNLGYRNKVSAVITNGNRNLLVVQLTSYGEGHWNFPGGGVENGESEKQAILRELKEELGTNMFEVIKRSKLVDQYEWPPFVIAQKLKEEGRTWRGQNVRYFLINFVGEDKDIKPDPGEIRKVKWVEREKLKDHFVFPGQFESAKKVTSEFFRLTNSE